MKLNPYSLIRCTWLLLMMCADKAVVASDGAQESNEIATRCNQDQRDWLVAFVIIRSTFPENASIHKTYAIVFAEKTHVWWHGIGEQLHTPGSVSTTSFSVDVGEIAREITVEATPECVDSTINPWGDLLYLGSEDMRNKDAVTAVFEIERRQFGEWVRIDGTISNREDHQWSTPKSKSAMKRVCRAFFGEDNIDALQVNADVMAKIGIFQNFSKFVCFENARKAAAIVIPAPEPGSRKTQ